MRRVLLFVILGLVLACPAWAGAAFPTVTVDENGNGALWDGTRLNYFLGSPGPLNYVLPFTPNSGYVVMLEDDPTGANPLVSDVIVFMPTTQIPGQSLLVFYSDPGDTDYADHITLEEWQRLLISLPTTAPRIFEVGPEGNNGAWYTPGPNEPGFLAAGAAPIQYHFISDSSVVPLPAAAWMGLGLLGGMGLIRKIRGRRRSA